MNVNYDLGNYVNRTERNSGTLKYKITHYIDYNTQVERYQFWNSILKFGSNNIVDQSNDRAAKIYFRLYDK